MLAPTIRKTIPIAVNRNLSYFAVFCKPRKSPQLCAKLWRFFITPDFPLGFPQLFLSPPVEKPVENVDNCVEQMVTIVYGINYVNCFHNVAEI